MSINFYFFRAESLQNRNVGKVNPLRFSHAQRWPELAHYWRVFCVSSTLIIALSRCLIRPVVRQQTYVGKGLVVSLAAIRRSCSLLPCCPAFLVWCLPLRVNEVQEGGSTCDRDGGDRDLARWR